MSWKATPHTWKNELIENRNRRPQRDWTEAPRPTCASAEMTHGRPQPSTLRALPELPLVDCGISQTAPQRPLSPRLIPQAQANPQLFPLPQLATLPSLPRASSCSVFRSHLSPGLANYRVKAESAHRLVLSIKIYWNTATPIHLRVPCGWFHTQVQRWAGASETAGWQGLM